jgi:hypothetical protein
MNPKNKTSSIVDERRQRKLEARAAKHEKKLAALLRSSTRGKIKWKQQRDEAATVEETVLPAEFIEFDAAESFHIS